MQYYSDYYRAVEGYLRNHEPLKTAIENMQQDIEAKTEYLKQISTPIAKYGVSGGGSSDKLTSPESESDIRIRMAREITDLQQEIRKIQTVLTKVSNSLAVLSDDQRTVLELRYMQRLDWWRISDQMHLSARQCQRLNGEAIRMMTLTIFGLRGYSPEQRFVFFS